MARIFFVYGPGEARGRLVPSAIDSLLAGRPFELADGRRERDFLFVEDVASALARLLSSSLTGPMNIGSGQATSLQDLVLAIASRLGCPELVRVGEPVEPAGAQPPAIVADTARLREELLWTPAVSLRTGVAKTVGSWRGAESEATQLTA